MKKIYAILSEQYDDVSHICCISAASCSFEYGRCGWTESADDSDSFDWRRIQGKTPSFGTGPITDHTTNSTSGYYLYIESSSGTAYQNAKLVSQTYKRVMITIFDEEFSKYTLKHEQQCFIGFKTRGDSRVF